MFAETDLPKTFADETAPETLFASPGDGALYARFDTITAVASVIRANVISHG